MKNDITELAQREKFEAWFKSSFHPDKTGPYIKDQLYFAWKAAGAELVEALEKAQRRISRLESRSVKLPHRNLGHEKLFLLCPFPYYDAEDMEKALAAAGIKWEVE